MLGRTRTFRHIANETPIDKTPKPNAQEEKRHVADIPDDIPPSSTRGYYRRTGLGIAGFDTTPRATPAHGVFMMTPTSSDHSTGAASSTSPSSPPPPSASLSVRRRDHLRPSPFVSGRPLETPKSVLRNRPIFTATPGTGAKPTVSSTPMPYLATPSNQYLSSVTSPSSSSSLSSAQPLPTPSNPFARLVTVFGYPREQASTVLRELNKCGNVVRRTAGTGNWTIVEYDSALSAELALGRHGDTVAGGVIVGVKPTEAHEMSAEMLGDVVRRAQVEALQHAQDVHNYATGMDRLDAFVSSAPLYASSPLAASSSTSTSSSSSSSMSSRTGEGGEPDRLVVVSGGAASGAGGLVGPSIRRRVSICSRLWAWLTHW